MALKNFINFKLISAFSLIFNKSNANNLDTLYFKTINIYSLFNDKKNIEDLKTWEVINPAYIQDCNNEYFEFLPFFSIGKSIDEVDFEIFSTYSDYQVTDKHDVFRRSKDYKNKEIIQEYFYKKYKIKFFIDLPVTNESIDFSDELFSDNKNISLKDFIDIIKPNFNYEFSKTIDSNSKLLFNWNFFLHDTRGYRQSTLLANYRFSNIHHKIAYNEISKDELTKYKTILQILVESSSLVDVNIDGLVLGNNQNTTEVINIFFSKKRNTYYTKIVQNYLEPKFWNDIDEFILDNKFSENNFLYNMKKVEDYFLNYSKPIFIEK